MLSRISGLHYSNISDCVFDVKESHLDKPLLKSIYNVDDTLGNLLIINYSINPRYLVIGL